MSSANNARNLWCGWVFFQFPTPTCTARKTVTKQCIIYIFRTKCIHSIVFKILQFPPSTLTKNSSTELFCKCLCTEGSPDFSGRLLNRKQVVTEGDVLSAHSVLFNIICVLHKSTACLHATHLHFIYKAINLCYLFIFFHFPRVPNASADSNNGCIISCCSHVHIFSLANSSKQHNVGHIAQYFVPDWNISITIRWFGMHFTNIYCLSKLNSKNFDDLLIFPLAPSSAKNVLLIIWFMTHYLKNYIPIILSCTLCLVLISKCLHNMQNCSSKHGKHYT